MIISRTPLRMSFAGGGSDLPSYYQEFGGAVLSTAINKYVYVNVNRKFDDGIRVGYSKNEEVSKVNQIEHPLVRNSLEYLKIPGGIEITTIADIPSNGTGLGSSSTFTVGLLNALNAYLGNAASPEQLAKDACHVEIGLCAEPIGKQDQYAAAFGGLNLIEFYPNESVSVTPIACSSTSLKQIQDHLLVFYTGKTRSASSLLEQQAKEIAQDGQKKQSIHKMVQLARDLAVELQANRVAALGEILHEGWMLKKGLVKGISEPEIDAWYERALAAGAQGGKILGAGAGGFLMLFASPERHEAIKQALSPLRSIPMGFDYAGTQIIFNEKIA